MKRSVVIIGIVVGVIIMMVGTVITAYNGLNSLEQAAVSQWAQVQNVYQRRADLVPNLVETVKGAANFERETLIAVTEARARVGQVAASAAKAPTDPENLKQFQAAQDQLSGALSRLLVVSEAYPELRATQNFRDLQSQLEGSENRITVERHRFNETAQAFNTRRNAFPTVVIAGFFGSRFAVKPYFQAIAGSDVAPKVKF